MEYEELISLVERIGGLRGDAAERAVVATVTSLTERLESAANDALCAELPSRLAERRRHSDKRPLDMPTFFEAVGRREQAPRGFGKEHAEIVCRAIADLLPDSTLAHLRECLPSSAVPLFERSVATDDALPVVYPAPHQEGIVRQTLAAGSPGSRHPISVSQPDEALAPDAMARSVTPHADTKLSTSRGTTQERLRETLADGKPGPDRPISTTR